MWSYVCLFKFPTVNSRSQGLYISSPALDYLDLVVCVHPCTDYSAGLSEFELDSARIVEEGVSWGRVECHWSDRMIWCGVGHVGHSLWMCTGKFLMRLLFFLNIWWQIYDHIYGYQYMISSIWLQAYDFKYMITSIWFHVYDFLHVYDFTYMIFARIWFHVYDFALIWFQVYDYKYMITSIWIQTYDS